MEVEAIPPVVPIEVRTLHGDLLSVDPHGARIKLILSRIPILTSVARGDGKTGTTHPCSPIFDEDINNIYGLLGKHGKMRDELSEIIPTDQSEVMLDHEITDSGYPKGVRAIQVTTVKGGIFSYSLAHKNEGEEAAAANGALHCYFDAPNGFKGTKINKQDITQLIRDNPNGTGIDLLEENIIEIPGKPPLILKQNGFNGVFVWVGRNPKTGEIDNDYVCIEPIEFHPNDFGLEKTIIQPGNERIAKFSLAIKAE